MITRSSLLFNNYTLYITHVNMKNILVIMNEAGDVKVCKNVLLIIRGITKQLLKNYKTSEVIKSYQNQLIASKRTIYQRILQPP